MAGNGTALIYAIHRTDAWWRCVGQHLGYDKSIVVSDLRGVGDYSVVDDFYTAYQQQHDLSHPQPDLLREEQVVDIIARCRLLRWLPERQARAMIFAMAVSFDRILESEQPSVVLSFPIDRYVSDVLERLAAARGIPYYELTASLVSGMSMLLYRGQLIKVPELPDETLIEEKTKEIAHHSFTPSYVRVNSQYSLHRFFRIFIYFKVRGWAFKAISKLKRDPLNLHYLDAQSFLGHKPNISDREIIKLCNSNWHSKLDSIPKNKRIFFGLQLFPEASIDYWIKNVELIQHEEVLLEAATAFSSSGFLILIKDHPLQYGFRQVALLKRLLALPNVVLVPYEVSGNEVLSVVGANFTCTGTLGLQAALLGLKSVSTATYYTTEEDFIIFNSRDEIKELPRRVLEAIEPESLSIRQRRIIAHLLQGSFNSDFFSFKGFDATKPAPAVIELAKALGKQMRKFNVGKVADTDNQVLKSPKKHTIFS